jgi:hypothetical protein
MTESEVVARLLLRFPISSKLLAVQKPLKTRVARE